MLEPKKIKFRKVHRGHRKGMAKGGTEVSFGSYGMFVRLWNSVYF